MSAWLKNSLFVVVMLCATIIGVRVYLDLSTHSAATEFVPEAGHVAGAPDMLPEFVLNDVYGDPRNIREWAGKPLLVNFWATWCAPCRREIPLLETLHKEQAGIEVVGIAIDRQSDVEAFIGEFGVSYPNLVGQEDALAVSDQFGLEGLGLPFTVLAAADGRILTVHIGEIDAAQLAEMVSVSRAYASGELPLLAARAKLTEL